MPPENAAEPMIEGRGIVKVFNDFWGRPKVHALKGVDITVRPGAVFGLLGPNGAGKSTLMKIILGHLYCTEGVVRVLGKSPRDVMAKKRVGYLPERTAFYPSLTARETLLFFGRLLGLPDLETKRRIKQLLKMVGLEHAEQRLAGEFSHGMRKRLGLAQALLNDPDLLLLDEPTAGLDPIGCREIKDLLLTLGRRGKTILMTSHLLADVQDVCAEILIIYGGQTQAYGPVGTLLAKTDELQIRSPLVPKELVDNARRELEKAAGAGTVSVSYPTRTLEDYFLSVVAAAKRANKGTSGADMGDGVAEYLKAGADLETPPPPPAIPAPAPAPIPEPEPEPKPAPAPPPQPTPMAPEPQPQRPSTHRASVDNRGVDSDILASLTRKKK